MKMHFLMITMFFMGSFSFVMYRKHMLMMLLSLEFIILSFLFLMFMYFLNLSNKYFFYTFFMFQSLRVLGLSLLVSLIRSHGSDYFSLLNSFWWNIHLV